MPAPLISQSIKAAEIIAYEDLGPEAVRFWSWKISLPSVINDCRGNDLYEQGLRQYARD